VLRNRQRQRLALQSLDSPQVDRYSGQLPSIFRRIACMLYESLLLLGVLSITFMVPHLILGMAFSMSLPGWLGQAWFISGSDCCGRSLIVIDSSSMTA
jgi:hypothetical protein